MTTISSVRGEGLRASLRRAGGVAARRLFLDRQVAFWLGEVRPTWSFTEIRARVDRVDFETPDVVTLVLAPNAAWPGHRAGQYVPVEVEIDGVRTRRFYSLISGSSAPGAARIRIAVKRVPGGRVSNFLHDRVRPGDVLGLGAPAGSFVLPTPAPAKLLLMSGGSGITPVVALLRDLVPPGPRRPVDVVFLHAARSLRDVPFRAELEALAATVPGFRLVLRLDDAPGARPLDDAALGELVPDLAERTTFLCGPPGLLDAAEAIFEARGIADRLHLERFVAARRPRQVAAVPAAAPPTVPSPVVTLGASGHVVDVAPSETLLEALERAGERPASGCRMGICNSCRCRKVAGVVEDTATGRTSADGDEWIRLCVSVPRSDVTLAR